MAKYVKKAANVDAVQFTAALGAELVAESHAAAEEGREPKPHASGIAYEEGRGYRLRGATVSFGDFLVTASGITTVVPKDEFLAAYELKGGK